ncbi:hypothetical protein HDU78_008985 [Chytriomyces hyalinus]|nr:hypothetical protein HDU78_008985 [Chytriomyces hyalinus]KAJ3260928.1 hypothetical protein HDU77_001141 [Chytriomyces hyalinus]
MEGSDSFLVTKDGVVMDIQSSPSLHSSTVFANALHTSASPVPSETETQTPTQGHSSTHSQAPTPNQSNSPTSASTQTVCPVCQVPVSTQTQWIEIGTLKPRFIRALKKKYPLRAFPPTHRICTRDLYQLMQARIDALLEEDQQQLSKLQSSAMKHLGEHEHHELNWQRQFEHGWTFGERCADMVAQFGGSWRFIWSLLGFLFAWGTTNVLLGQSFSTGTPWDPYPFTLLNLFLSTLAALQGPIIMMSQNRQTQLDRAQNDYVSKIILRSEHQVRHVNVKLDHLLSEQWRRLLEIQQTQVDLLQMMQLRDHGSQYPTQPGANGGEGESARSSHVFQQVPVKEGSMSEMDLSIFLNPNATPSNAFGMSRRDSTALAAPSSMSNLPVPAMQSEFHWSVETHPDDHVRMLLALHFGLDETTSPYAVDDLLFAHWHTDGDNFIGFIQNVTVEVKNSSPVVRRVVYDLTFNDPSASLDDVFAGEGTVELRNDMDVKCMDLDGRYLRIEIHHKNQASSVYPNGDLPPRYKSTFHLKREDKITDFWRAKLVKLNLTYSPPHQVAVLSLARGQICERMRVDFFPENTVNHAKVYMRRLDLSSLVPQGTNKDGADNEMLSYMKEVVGPRPLSKNWIPVAHALWPENSVPGSNLVADMGGSNNNNKSNALVGTGGVGSGDDAIVAGGGEDGEMLMEAGLVTVEFKERLVGPAVYVFLCDETRVSFRGVVV